jgi:drug/metabolite transporter (DMT)-like permease
MRVVAAFKVLPANIRGALWLVAGSFIFTGVGVFIRLASAHLDSLQISFFRAAFGLAFIVPILWRQNLNPFASGRLWEHFNRAVMGTAAMVCGFYAISHLLLADATAISFSQPLFITMIAALLLREPVRWRRWSATIVGFAGVVIMMHPGPGTLQLASLVAVAAAFLSAMSIIYVKRLSESEPAVAILATFAVFSTVLLLIPAIFVWRWPGPLDWVYLAAIGLLATIGQYFMVRAYEASDASFVAPFDYLRLPFSAALGFFVFTEWPTWWTLAGALIIVASTFYIARREAKLGVALPGKVSAQKPPA